MKRYLLFVYVDYYPSGGWNDFKGSFDTIEEAMCHEGENGEIVDSQTGQVVKELICLYQYELYPNKLFYEWRDPT